MKKILIFETALFTPHTETGLEIFFSNKSQGNCTKYVPLYNILTNIETHLFCDNKFHKDRCAYITPKIKSLIGSNDFIEPNIENIDAKIPVFSADPAIFKLYIEQFPIGPYLYNNITQYIKNSEVNLKHKETFELARELYSIGVQSYYYSKRIIEQTKPDIIYVCNGRFMSQAGTVWAARATDTTYYIHERGPDLNNFFLNKYLHDHEGVHDDLRNINANVDQEILSHVANQFYTGIREGAEKSWPSFIGNQKGGELPAKIKNRSFMSYFQSSDFESGTFPGNNMDRGLGRQKKAFQKLKSLCEKLNKFLVVRMHPNQANGSVEDFNFWKNQQSENTLVIEPTDPTDTYELMDKSEIVTTFSSSVGIEAAYNYKPVIVLGRCYYETCDEIMKPRSEEELESFLCNPSKPRKRKGAEIFGYYTMMNSIPHYYYKPIATFDGTIKGVTLFDQFKMN